MSRTTRKIRHDIDYWHKLSPEDRKWLSQALREIGGYPVAKGTKRLSKDVTRAGWREAKRRREDVTHQTKRIPLERVQHRLQTPEIPQEKVEFPDKNAPPVKLAS